MSTHDDSPQDEEEENIDVCDNGGTQDEDTNQFDEIVGCLAGMALWPMGHELTMLLHLHAACFA